MPSSAATASGHRLGVAGDHHDLGGRARAARRPPRGTPGGPRRPAPSAPTTARRRGRAGRSRPVGRPVGRSAARDSAARRSRSRRGPPTATVRPSTVGADPDRGRRRGSRSRRGHRQAAVAGPRPRSPGPAGARCRPRRRRPARAPRPPVDAGRWRRVVTAGSPLVRVPVLSNSTVSTVRIRSSAARSLTSTPPRAARSVEMDDHQRDRQAQRVRAGDDQHGDRPDQRVSGSPSTVQTTAVIDGGAEGKPEQPARGPVGQQLRPGGGAAPGPPAAGSRPARCPRRPRSPAPGSRCRWPRCRRPPCRPSRAAPAGTRR